MCIIIAKPANAEMPARSVLETCWNNNPDGAGFMWTEEARVRIRKGYMTFQGFMDALESCIQDATASAVVMHFRIATHGEIRPECCHPFPVSADLDRLRSRRCADLVGVAHNGIIQGMKTDALTSDTMAYIARVLAPLRALDGSCTFDTDKRAGSVIASTVGSKLAFLHRDGSINTFGDFIEDGGVLYSNSTYRVPKWSYDYWRPYSSEALDVDAPWDECRRCYCMNDCKSDGWYCNTLDEAREMTEPIDWADFLPSVHCSECGWCDICSSYGAQCANLEEVMETLEDQKC